MAHLAAEVCVLDGSEARSYVAPLALEQLLRRAARPLCARADVAAMGHASGLVVAADATRRVASLCKQNNTQQPHDRT
jgi:hypothetical protein